MTKKEKEYLDSLPAFNEWQNEYYKQHPEEIELLEQAMLEELEEYPEMPVEAFLGQIRRIAELRGIARLAKASGLNRESLYKTLSTKGNPTLHTLNKIAAAMGCRLAFVPLKTARGKQS